MGVMGEKLKVKEAEGEAVCENIKGGVTQGREERKDEIKAGR